MQIQSIAANTTAVYANSRIGIRIFTAFINKTPRLLQNQIMENICVAMLFIILKNKKISNVQNVKIEKICNARRKTDRLTDIYGKI
jgi:hypothetical protein